LGVDLNQDCGNLCADMKNKTTTHVSKIGEWLELSATNGNHTVSITLCSDPWVTSQKRIDAHLQNLIKQVEELANELSSTEVHIDNATAQDLQDAIAEAKKQADGNYFTDWQVAVIKDGEYLNGTPAYHGTSYCKISDIRELAERHRDQADFIQINGGAYRLGDYGTIIERQAEAEPTGDWFSVKVHIK
jgi:hypothetical protein